MDGTGSRDSSERVPTDLRSLTSLRFAAAMLVVLAHWNVTAGRVPSMFGAAGVEFFFVLSGFILTHVYAGAFRSGGSIRRQMRAFWLARFARIYPLHILTMAAVALLGLVKIRPGLEGIAAGSQLLLIQSWIPLDNIPFAFNGPAWTISDEAFFYAAFPFALVVLCRARLSMPTLAATFTAIWLTASAFDLSTDASQAPMQWLIYVFPLPRLADFACGILAGLAFERRRLLASAAVATVAEVGALCAVTLGIAVSPSLPPAYGFGSCMLPVWTILIVVFAAQRGLVSRALAAGPFVALGEASFALYMVHHIIMDKMNGWPALLTACAVAIAVHRLYEVPARKLIRGLRHPIAGSEPDARPN